MHSPNYTQHPVIPSVPLPKSHPRIANVEALSYPPLIDGLTASTLPAKSLPVLDDGRTSPFWANITT
jgi:hypothetical protein